jgi:hypothetical protein
VAQIAQNRETRRSSLCGHGDLFFGGQSYDENCLKKNSTCRAARSDTRIRCYVFSRGLAVKKKLTFMWPWQVKLWTHHGNMIVCTLQ